MTQSPRDELSPSSLQRLESERDLCVGLLALSKREDLDPFLSDALELIVDATGAEIAYLELRANQGGEDIRWSMGHQCSSLAIEEIQERISTGIIAEALTHGETIRTQLALADERFDMRASVQAGQIEGVICAPIGGSAALGVVYLQSKQGAPPFSDFALQLVELFALHLSPLADRLLATHLLREEEDPTRELRLRFQLEGIVGRSRSLGRLLEQAMLAAPLDINMLLTGSSGTGKSQLARVIHRNSDRGDAPFVELNCAALPETLIESELFGAMAGSHSEAKRDRAGLVAAAEGGTLFLDEVGELPLPAQSKLLQLLQSSEYYPLGATRPSRANIRVIAATNADLERACQENRFREDLFFRLQVLPLRLPDLEERRDDLPELARVLLAQSCKTHGLPDLSLTRAGLFAIEAAEWPGNVRQLQNALEAAAVRALGEGAGVVDVEHVFPERIGEGGGREGRTSTELTFQAATRDFQKRLLASVLDETEWNVTEVAKRLDLARSHVYNLMKTFNLKRKR